MLAIMMRSINHEQNPPRLHQQPHDRSTIENRAGIGKIDKLFDDRSNSSIDPNSELSIISGEVGQVLIII